MKYVRTKDDKIYILVKVTNVDSYEFQQSIVKQANSIHELCDSFEVVRRFDGYTFKFRSYKKAFDRWFGDGWQGVSDDMYGLIKGKRVAIMRGYTEGKHPNKIEMELL